MDYVRIHWQSTGSPAYCGHGEKVTRAVGEAWLLHFQENPCQDLVHWLENEDFLKPCKEVAGE